MNSEMVFTFKDLLLFGLWGCLVTVLIYLIRILRRTFLTMKDIQSIVKDNKRQIDATMDIIPQLTQNVETISQEVAHDIQAFRSTVDNIADTTEAVTETIKSNKGVMEGLSSIMHSAAITKALYDKFFGEKVKAAKDVFNSVEKEPEEHVND